MITENTSTLKINKLTKEQYIREKEAGNIDTNAFYLTPDETADLTIYATKEDIEGLEESKQDASTAITTDNIASQSVNHAKTADGLTGVTATASELNVLDGITASTAELNYMDGVTSPVQTQIDGLNSNLESLNSDLTHIKIADFIENANQSIIQITHDASFVENGLLHLNLQMVLSESRGGSGALFRYKNYYVLNSTQFFMIIGFNDHTTNIGYANPSDNWLKTSHSLNAGEYRVIGTLKLNN